ncbi:MAG: hypothetical protein B7Y37_04545 [Sphingobacteriia bacterium 28-36-52]|nr:MAG: hypothetical protein B7Y37_04545 [Sphingobacteriia bacterium 28-36-52]
MTQDNYEELKIIVNDFEFGRVNKHLRKIFIIYLQSEYKNLPIDFADVLIDFEQLFDLLDFLGKWSNPNLCPNQ